MPPTDPRVEWANYPEPSEQATTPVDPRVDWADYEKPTENTAPPTDPQPGPSGDGGGEPPAEPPFAAAASEPDGPDAWFERMAAEQADWNARMDAERAEWLHGLADQEVPGTMDERWARFEAETADWLARISAERADFLWEIAGGRPDPGTPEPPNTPDDPTPGGPGPSDPDGPAPATPKAPTRPGTDPAAATPTDPRVDWAHNPKPESVDLQSDPPADTPGNSTPSDPAKPPIDPTKPPIDPADPPTDPRVNWADYPASPEPVTAPDPRAEGVDDRTSPENSESLTDPRVDYADYRSNPESATPAGETPTVPLQPGEPTVPGSEAPTVEVGPRHEATAEVTVRDPLAAVPPGDTHAVQTQPMELPSGARDDGAIVAPVEPVRASPALRVVGEFLSESPGPIAGARIPEREGYGRQLASELGLGPALARHVDPLASLREVAERARARGYFGDPELGVPPRAMRAEDLGPLAADERERGLDPRTRPDPGTAARRDLPLEPWSQVNRDLSHQDPRVRTLDELRAEIADRLGLAPDDLTRQHLPDVAGELQLRNLLRAGAIDALDMVSRQRDQALDPAERARLTADRDEWARLLRIDDPQALSPANRDATIAALHEETLRRAADVADLMAATFHAQSPGDGIHAVLTAGDDRVHIRVTENPDGSKRVEVVPRPNLPQPPEPGKVVEEKRPGLLRRIWQRMMGGYHADTPKYPSGSGWDKKGQVNLTHGLGDLIHNDVLAHIDDDFNPVRAAKEIATIYQDRERMPILHRITARIADISADVVPMHTRDGQEYQPWYSEADPVLRAEIEESLRLAGLPTEADYPEIPAPQPDPDRPQLEAPHEKHWGPDMPEPLAAALDARDAALADLVRIAGEQHIDLPNAAPEALRRAVDNATYELMRRAGAIEALRDVAARFNVEHERVPYSPVSFSDKDPLGRYVREARLAEAMRVEEERAQRRREAAGASPDDDSLEFRPREPRASALDALPVNNGGEWVRHFEDPDEELSARREGQLFEDALMRDQIRDERSNWAQLIGESLDGLTPEQIRHTIGDLRMELRDSVDRLGDFIDAVDRYQQLDAEARTHARDLADIAAHAWLDGQGGVMLEPGVGVHPGAHPGDPHRLVVIRGDSDHDARLADALAAHPDLGAQLNRGELQLDYHVIGLADNGQLHVNPHPTPEVLFHQGPEGGDRLPMLMVRDGDGPWRIVQPIPEPPIALDPHSTPDTMPAVPRDPDIVRAERNEVAARLSVYRMDLGPGFLEDTIRALRHDNALRAAQIEGMADFIRSSDAIDNFHDLNRRLENLANRLRIDPEDLSPRALAEAMADPAMRQVRRLQAIGDLLDYAKVLRDNVDAATVLAARDRLAHRLGVEPEDLYSNKHVVDKKLGEVVGYAPDPKSTNPNGLLHAVNDLLHRSGLNPELVAALGEYVNTLSDLDPFRRDLHIDPARDPRAADGVVPIHDPAAPALLRALMNESIGEPPISDNPSQAASAWSRLLGVDVNDIARTVELYEERGKSLHDRLSPAQLGEVLRILDSGDAHAAYDFYRQSIADQSKLLSPQELTRAVDTARNTRYAEVYEYYRDGKIDKHERLSPEKLAEVVDTMRAEVRAREADIQELERLADEHNRLTTPPEPVAPQRGVRDLVDDLATARHQLDLARDAREHAVGRMYLENNRPIVDGDLTPERIRGTADYLSTRNADEAGTLPDHDRRIADLVDAAGEYTRAETRVAELESQLREAVQRESGPGETPVDVWQRESDSARTDLESLIAADPDLARVGLDRVVDQVDRMSRMPLDQADIWTDDLIPLRDAVHRYQHAREFLDIARAEQAESARAAETPEQAAARELEAARRELLAADANLNAALFGLPLTAANLTPDAVAATRREFADAHRPGLSAADRARLDLADAADRRHQAQDRVSRWEAEQARQAAAAAIAADTPEAAAQRAHDAAHTTLREAITNLRDVTGLNVDESRLTPAALDNTMRELQNSTIRLTTGDPADAFRRLRSAAEQFHRADAFSDWVATHAATPPADPRIAFANHGDQPSLPHAEPAVGEDPATVPVTREDPVIGTDHESAPAKPDAPQSNTPNDPSAALNSEAPPDDRSAQPAKDIGSSADNDGTPENPVSVEKDNPAVGTDHDADDSSGHDDGTGSDTTVSEPVALEPVDSDPRGPGADGSDADRSNPHGTASRAPDPDESDPPTWEPGSSQPDNSDRDHSEPGKPEPGKPEPGKPEPDKPEPDNSEPDNSDHSEPGGSEPGGSEPDSSSRDHSEPHNSEPDASEPHNSEPDASDPDGSEPHASDPDDPNGDDPDSGEGRRREEPNWGHVRSHIPHVPHQDPDYNLPDYAPKPSLEPYPWTLPPADEQPQPQSQPQPQPQSHPQPQPQPHPQPQPQPHPQPGGPGGPSMPQPHMPQPQSPPVPEPPVPPHIPTPPEGWPPGIPWPPTAPYPPAGWPPGCSWPPIDSWPPGIPMPGWSEPPTGYGLPQQPTVGWPGGSQPNGSNGWPNSSQPSYGSPGTTQPSPSNAWPTTPSNGAPQQYDPAEAVNRLLESLGERGNSGTPGSTPSHGVPGAPSGFDPNSDPGSPHEPTSADHTSNGAGTPNGSGAPVGGAPMMPPGAAPVASNGAKNGRGDRRFPRAGGGPARNGTIYLRSHSGYGEFATFDPGTGQLQSAPMATGALSGVYGDLDGVRVVFYRAPHGLVLRVGDQAIEVDQLGAEARWERTTEGFTRLVIAAGGHEQCELRYRPVGADADLGLLIRDVLADPMRRVGIFG
ncbi:hypothetical protein [Nocardia acidivorans]|uniref:hypothetical protein n=1 Tax=Nocardia acidivorans TaxID=404580 RepID=UPI0012FC8EA7|nr:hypothetical protein [Nocardia acidivorans]